MQEDWKSLLMGALPWFKFPRVPLDIGIDEEDGTEKFVSDLSNEEI